MISFIRQQTGITQFNLSCLLGITRQQLSMNELGKRSLPLEASTKLLCIYNALQNLPTLPDDKLEALWVSKIAAYKKKLNKALHEIQLQQQKLQQQLTASRETYTQAVHLWQLCLALQNEATFADAKDRLVMEASIAAAKSVLRKHHPYLHLEMEMELQFLLQRAQLIAAALNSLPE